MSNAALVRKVVERLAKTVSGVNTGDGQFLPDDESWKVKSSNMHPSDDDWYIGFGNDNNTANEAKNEYDPKTGKLVKNNMVSNRTTYLQQWDSRNGDQPYLEDKEKDNTGFVKIVMQQITPIK